MELNEDDEIHQVHCLFCIRATCQERQCRIVDCELKCGAKFHPCKGEEHTLLCSNRKTPCINSIHGCPKIVANSKRGTHLETCPASAIFCSMEWNRWPVYTDERKLYSSLSRLPVRVNCAQLDMALAMRDQRMLNKARKVPRRMKRVLRNHLTRRYPAVPIQYRECSEDEESTATSTISDDEDTPWDLVAMPPGLQRSVCSKLYLAQQQERLSRATIEELSPFSSLEDLNEPVDVISELNGSVTCHYSVHAAQDESDHEHEVMYIYNAEANEYAGKGTNTGTGTSTTDTTVCNGTTAGIENIASAVHSTVENTKGPIANCHTVLCDLLDVDLNLEFISRYQPKPRTMYTFLCAQEFRRDEYPWHTCNVHTDIHYGLNGWLEQRCPLAQYGCTYSVRRLYPNSTGYKIVHSKLLESFGIKPMSNTEMSSLKKSPSVDSYWNQKRGSSTTTEKFFSLPNITSRGDKREGTPEVRTSMVYERHVEIVDRGRSMSPERTSYDEMRITDLPDEILRTVVKYLDGFSLNCLSMTCHQLREVCCSLLEERGIVVCEWQRYHHGDQVRWRQSHKRWMFTRAFSPVRKWLLADSLPISEHLKTCPFNLRMEHTRPELLEVKDWPGMKNRLKQTEKVPWWYL